MRPLLTLPLLLATFATGCVSASHRVREEAKVTLRCNAVQVKNDRQHEVWVADGCGRLALCVLPKADRAEVMCYGGGPKVATY